MPWSVSIGGVIFFKKLKKFFLPRYADVMMIIFQTNNCRRLVIEL